MRWGIQEASITQRLSRITSWRTRGKASDLSLVPSAGQHCEKFGALSGVSNVRFVPLAEKRQRLLVGLPAAAAVERMAERIVRIVRGARENRVTDAVKPGRRGAACGKMSHIQ